MDFDILDTSYGQRIRCPRKRVKSTANANQDAQKMNARNTIGTAVLATAIATACSWATAQDITLYESHTLPDSIVFEPNGEMSMRRHIDLIVTGSKDFYLRKSFKAGEPIEFNPAELVEGGLADGTYGYELQIMGIEGTASDRESGKVAIQERLNGGFGSFAVIGGKLVSPTTAEPVYKGADAGITIQGSTAQSSTDADDGGTRYQVFADDLIVTGSLCVGFDCVDGEAFGFDTIRMKENNTRIKFEDTSTGSFPADDWQLTANDSASGGLNRFSIEDVTGARVPFTVEAGAASNSIYVDSTSRVGFRTTSPVLDAHFNTGNPPGICLEQNGSAGFTAQIWDIAGNESNVFIRDVTNSSLLPFRIRPSAPTTSVDITANGDVSIGLAGATAPVQVRRSDDTFEMLFLEQLNNNVVQDRNMM